MYETETVICVSNFALIKQDNLLETHADKKSTHVCSQCWYVSFMAIIQWGGD